MMNEAIRRNILIIDPERDTGELFARALENRRDFKCYFTSTEEEALSLLKEIPFDLVLTDLSTVMGSDFGLLKKIKRASPQSIIILDAYLHQTQHIPKGLSHGAHDYIIKPIKLESFRKKMAEVCVGAAG